jgi:hypothetical protein
MKKIYLYILISVLSCNLFSQSLPSYVPTNGLVGWWPFNGNANDESGNGNNGTVNGATLTTDRFGNAGKAYSFDGINDRIKISHNSNFTNDTGSVSLWFNSNQLPTVIDNQDCLFGKGWGYPQIVLRNDGKVYLSIANSTSSFSSISSNNFLPINQWFNVVCIYKGASLNIYINAVSSNSQTITPAPNFYSYCNSDYFIGGFRHLNNCMPNDSVQFFNGKLDDIGIWNRALTQAEITALYTSNGVGIQGQSLNQISIYPNPAKTQITITSKSELTGKSIKVYDALGKVVYENVIKPNQLTLNIAAWANGIYTIAIPEQGLTYKFVKE